MVTVALKGLAGRKLRASLTAIAIVLGVAMISGTYVLTDTINNGFDTIFTQSYQNADLVITGTRAAGVSGATVRAGRRCCGTAVGVPCGVVTGAFVAVAWVFVAIGCFVPGALVPCATTGRLTATATARTDRRSARMLPSSRLRRGADWRRRGGTRLGHVRLNLE